MKIQCDDTGNKTQLRLVYSKCSVTVLTAPISACLACGSQLRLRTGDKI